MQLDLALPTTQTNIFSKSLQQVIVIPIYWKKREDEANRVLTAATDIKRLLEQHGLRAGLDDSEMRTPGQKYRFWEERNVKARVEIGPKDALAGQCVVAQAAPTPGQLATKQTLKVCKHMTSTTDGHGTAAAALGRSYADIFNCPRFC